MRRAVRVRMSFMEGDPMMVDGREVGGICWFLAGKSRFPGFGVLCSGGNGNVIWIVRNEVRGGFRHDEMI